MKFVASAPSLPAAIANLTFADASDTAFSRVALLPLPPRLMFATSPETPLAATQSTPRTTHEYCPLPLAPSTRTAQT